MIVLNKIWHGSKSLFLSPPSCHITTSYFPALQTFGELSHLPKQPMSSMLSSVRGLLVDLSGTVHVGDVAVQGAVDAVKRLKDAGVPVKFVTNTSKESSQRLHQRLL